MTAVSRLVPLQMTPPPSPELYCAVSENVTEVRPELEAVMLIEPDLFGVVYVTLTWPAELEPPDPGENFPPAPPSLKVTVLPETEFPYWSVTDTTKGRGSVVP